MTIWRRILNLFSRENLPYTLVAAIVSGLIMLFFAMLFFGVLEEGFLGF